MQNIGNAVGLFGSGAVAQALGRALLDSGEPVVALAARDPGRAAQAAAFIGPGVEALDAASLVRRVSRIVVAVSDEAITPVAEVLAAAGFDAGIALHTCGARGPDALGPLAAAGVACGVLHPLQTVPTPARGVDRLRGITYGVGGAPEAVAWAESLAARLESRALHVSAHGFPAYHAAATLAANSMAAFVDGAMILMDRAGVDSRAALDALAPLCRASLENVLETGPEAALTGPVARGDAATVGAHVRALADGPAELASLYRASARYLVGIARRRGLTERAARRITLLLESAEGERT